MYSDLLAEAVAELVDPNRGDEAKRAKNRVLTVSGHWGISELDVMMLGLPFFVQFPTTAKTKYRTYRYRILSALADKYRGIGDDANFLRVRKLMRDED